MEIFGVEAFLLLLDHFEFFSEIRGLFTVTHSSFSSVSKNHVSLTDTAAASVTQINASTSMSVQSESSSLSKSRASLAPTDDERFEIKFDRKINPLIVNHFLIKFAVFGLNASADIRPLPGAWVADLLSVKTKFRLVSIGFIYYAIFLGRNFNTIILLYKSKKN